MKDDRLYLHHMLERCLRLTRFINPGKETFMESEALQDAVIRNLEVIGEAAKRVSCETLGPFGLTSAGHSRLVLKYNNILTHLYLCHCALSANGLLPRNDLKSKP